MVTVTKRLKENVTAALVYIILAVVIIYPIGQLFLSSFRIDRIGRPSVWTLTNFSNLLGSRSFIFALKNTLMISAESVLLATVMGVFLAWLIARTDIPFKKYLEPLNMLPFYLSSLVGAISWELLAAPKTGLLNQLVRSIFDLSVPPFNIYSIHGISLVLGLFYTPYIYLFTVGNLQNMDPSLEEAARVSGASISYTTLRVTLPLATPAILSGSILIFVTAAGIFGVPLLLGSPGRVNTISTLIYSRINMYPPSYNGASALSSFLLLLTVALIILQRKILAGRRFWTVTGKGFRPRVISLGRWKWVALGMNLAYLSFILLPFLIMVIISFLPGWTGELHMDRLSLKNYYEVLFVDDAARRGFMNSMIIATGGACFAIFVCTVLAALIQRTRLPGRSGVDFIAMLPVTYPGIVLGVGFLIAWIKTPLYGTLWILMLAYVVHFLPTGLRSMQAVLGSISPDLEECGRVSGANWFGALGRILLPLMWPGVMSTWLLLFVTFIREVSCSLILFVYGTETVSVALIRIMEYQPQSVTAAFGSLQTIIILVAVFLIRRISSRFGIRVERG